MGKIMGLWLGEDTDKLKKMLADRENKKLLLDSEINEIKKELEKRENENK